MVKYFVGLLRYLFNLKVSKLALIDDKSSLTKKTKINRNARIINSNIGKYSYVGINSWICESDIGDFCSIASNVNIGLGNHTMNYLSTSPIFTEPVNATGFSWTKQDCSFPFQRVKIGNDVWIGYGALIMGGIKIGDGACIGAGAIVTKDVPSFAIVGGCPAKIIKYRFSEVFINKIKQNPWWLLPENEIKNKITEFQQTIE